MSSDHTCITCTGTKYDGACLTCQRCLKPFFLECYDSLPEVKEFLSGLNTLPAAKLQLSSTISTTPAKIVIKIKKIFTQQSVFGFTCVKCKNSGSFTEIMSKWDTEKQNLNVELNRLRDELKNLSESKQIEMNKLYEHMNQMDETNKQYVLNNSELLTQLTALKTHQSTLEAQLHKSNDANDANDEDGMQVDSELNDLSAKFESMFESLSTTVNSQITAMSQEIESRIKLEFSKMQNEIGSCAHKIENSAKRKKTLMNRNENGAINSTVINIDSGNRTDFSNLKPPSFPEIIEPKEVYTVLVSKFDTSITQQDVINHIVRNTGMNDNLFKLTEMKSVKETDANKRYVSYKITILQESVYKAISDEQLWAPDYSVRDFYTESNFRRKNEMQNRKQALSNWKSNRQNEYANKGFERRDFDQRKQRTQLPPRFMNALEKTVT